MHHHHHTPHGDAQRWDVPFTPHHDRRDGPPVAAVPRGQAVPASSTTEPSRGEGRSGAVRPLTNSHEASSSADHSDTSRCDDGAALAPDDGCDNQETQLIAQRRRVLERRLAESQRQAGNGRSSRLTNAAATRGAPTSRGAVFDISLLPDEADAEVFLSHDAPRSRDISGRRDGAQTTPKPSAEQLAHHSVVLARLLAEATLTPSASSVADD